MVEPLRPVIGDVLAIPRAPDATEAVADLFAWTPGDTAHFAIEVHLYIGGTDDPGSPTDSFETLICSPSWLIDNLAALQVDHLEESDWQTGLGYRTGRGLWLMPRWDADALRRDVEALFQDAAGPTWSYVANRLSRHLDWEYDYRFDDAVARTPLNLG